MVVWVVAVAAALQILYSMLFYVTCLAHLMHDCAMRTEAHDELVDELISRVKAPIVKNKRRANHFSPIGAPPQPGVTRW